MRERERQVVRLLEQGALPVDLASVDVASRPVSDVMTRSLITVAADTLVAAAERLAAQSGIHHLLVLAEGKLAGMVCGYDLRRAGRSELVSDCMSTPVFCVPAWVTLSEAAEIMHDNAVGCLPVIAGGVLLGVVTRGDLRKAGLQDEALRVPVCAACKSDHHVRLDPRTSGVAFCLECLSQGETQVADEEVGVGD